MVLFALTYQYVGVKLAAFSTELPINSWGTKTPLIKLSPREATLAAAVTASWLFVRLPMKKLIPQQQKAKTNDPAI